MGIGEDRRRRDASWNAEAIRRLRRHAGLSQRELAEQLNARQQTVSEWEQGAYTPRGTAARLLTRVAEDMQFPFKPGHSEDQGEDHQGGDRGEDRDEDRDARPTGE